MEYLVFAARLLAARAARGDALLGIEKNHAEKADGRLDQSVQKQYPAEEG